MATIGTAAERIGGFSAGLRRLIENLIQSNASTLEESIREQLESGRDGNGRTLAPTYLNDPYFDKYGAKAAQMARAYRNWKLKITPPQTGTLLGLPPRDPDVPNLRINGYFQNSITAVGKSGGVQIKGRVALANDIDSKYGDDIYKMGNEANEYFIKNIVAPALKDFLK